MCFVVKTHQHPVCPPSLSAGVWWLAQAVLDTLPISFQNQNTAVLWEQVIHRKLLQELNKQDKTNTHSLMPKHSHLNITTQPVLCMY